MHNYRKYQDATDGKSQTRERGIDYIVVKRGTGGKYKNVRDKIYMERKGSNNVAEIVRNGLIISWRRGGRGKGRYMKDKMYVERRRSNNAAEIV